MSDEGSTYPLQHSETAPVTPSLSPHGISINLPPGGADGRPPPVKHMSAPAYQSPMRHHQRTPSRSKEVKETLNARSHYGSSGDDDGTSVHRINQYVIKQEIGRGSFGAVHLATDQYGNEFAVKEFSKSRLRKRAQSNLLRKPNHGRRPGHLAAGLGFNSPMHRLSSSGSETPDANNSLSLIKEEIAIMKKLNHNNLVSLIEVLDDPQEDSLYMVLEMCKKGVAMKVGLDERADPYDDETCRCWFRDMILGIEYLHAQGIIHRDLKPDNCLITSDDVLKIVDFGVSEMFEKQSEMATAKSAGSPAFMPPELCVAKHGQVSGRAADIWSMGVTLYCLRYGHIPFEKGSMLELYDSIRDDDVPMEEEQDPNFADLMTRMLEKDPEKRITMEEIREHPWVTKNGTDTLLSAEENCSDLVEPPTEAEMNNAITGNMAHLLTVMSAVKRFKKLMHEKRGRMMEGIFGKDSRLVAPPNSINPRTRSQDIHDRKPVESLLATEGVHRPVLVDDDLARLPQDLDKAHVHETNDIVINSQTESQTIPHQTEAIRKQQQETSSHHPSPEHRRPIDVRSKTLPVAEHSPAGKGHAHDPLEDTLFLDIGVNPDIPEGHGDSSNPVVSESPGGVEENIYELAYQDEMQKIEQRRGREPSMYLTRRVEHREDLRHLSNIKDAGRHAARKAATKLDGLYNKSSTLGSGLGESGTGAARAVGDKISDSFQRVSSSGSAREGLDEWKEAAKVYASDSVEYSKGVASRASEKLSGWTSSSSKSGISGGEGFSGLVARAQAKARGEKGDGGSSTSTAAAANGDEVPTEREVEDTDKSAEPKPAQVPVDESAADPSTEQNNDHDSSGIPAMPGGFPTTPGVSSG